MIDLNKQKLELTYPCSWVYKIIVLESADIKQVVKDVISQREHTVKESKVSKKGKYKSYSLELLVHNDDDRKTMYEDLGKHKDIQMVL